MNMRAPKPVTPYDLFARRWLRQTPVVAAQFNSDGSRTAFLDEAGAIALCAAPDPEPIERRYHIAGDDGRATMRPRKSPAPPLLSVVAPDAPASTLVANGAKGFYVGDRAGLVYRLNGNCETIKLVERCSGAIVALDCAPTQGWLAASDSNGVCLWRNERSAQKLAVEGDVGALAFSHRGDRLAVAHGLNVTIFALGEGQPGIAATYPLESNARTLVWDHEDHWIAAPFVGEGMALLESSGERASAVHGFRTPVRHVAFSATAKALVASGAFRVAAWDMAKPPVDGDSSGALATGRPGLVIVECVAVHPKRNLVAAGYANGQIVIAALGGRDEFLVRHGGGAVRSLSWSSDGREIAVAADDEAAILALLPQMFK